MWVKNEHISQIDNLVVEIGKQIIDPGMWMEFLLKPVRMMEDQDITKVIGVLHC